MEKLRNYASFFIILFISTSTSCNNKNANESKDAIAAIDLKRGEVVLCGPPDKQFGTVQFGISCSEKVTKDFDLAMALLHSFEYDEAEKVFAKVIDQEPECAMAWWGVAMSNFHPLWAPPTPPELEKGSKAVDVARSSKQKTKKESDYIEAIALFYKDWKTVDHITRSNRFEKAMEKIYADDPKDKEAAVFYALALNGAADPADKTFA